MKPLAPSPATLAKYGLSLEEWLDLAGDGCYVCERPWEGPEGRRGVTDHEHVPGWKKMPPSERRKYVRGVICIMCNHFLLTKWGTVARHAMAAAYLIRYEQGGQWTS